MFGGATHVDNLAEYYKLLRGRLLTPGWREDDFRRVKDYAINAITRLTKQDVRERPVEEMNVEKTRQRVLDTVLKDRK